MESELINPLEKEKRRCRHHRTLNTLMKNDDSIVAYVVAYKRDDLSDYQAHEAGMCSEREAVAAHEYYAVNENGVHGGFYVFYEHPNGNVYETLTHLHRRIGTDVQFSDFPLIPRDVLMQYADTLVQNAPSLTGIQGIYLVGSIANGASKSEDIDLMVVSETCPIQTLEDKLDEHLDIFCFNQIEFNRLSLGGYKITQGMKQLYQKS